MKMLKYSFGLLATALILLSSCRDSVEPNVPYSTFDNGAYLRTITTPNNSTTFNYFDLAASKFALTLEAVDKEDGATVDNVEIRVRHSRLIAGVGFEYTPATDVLVKTIQASDFGTNTETRFLRTSFEVTATEAIAAVGLTPEDMAGGDVFEFRLVLNDKLGRSFSSNNVTTNVAGAPFYASPFQYRVNVICPSNLAGSYSFTQTGMQSPYGTCAGTISGTTVWTAIASTPGSYSISDGTFGFFDCYGDSWDSGSVRINDACGTLTMSGADKYGGTYTMAVLSSSATDLVFQWFNSFDETGIVTVKSTEGKPWPELN